MSEGFAGKRGPAERAAALAEKRADIGGHEAGKIVGVFHALLECERADVVAVVECDGAQFLQREHAFDVPGDGFKRALAIRVGIALAKFGGLLDVEPLRNVAAERIVRAGLVGEQIGDDSAAREFGNHVGAISHQADGRGFALADGILQNAQRFVEIVDHHVAVAGFHAPLDAFGIDVNSKKRRAIQSRGQRLRAAHAAHAAAGDEFSGEVALKMFSRGRGECFVGALQNSLRADVDPASGGHLAVHHQAGAVELVEMFPVVPVADEIRIGDQDARRVGVRAKNSDWLAGLHQKRFVIFERAKRRDDGVETFPVARGFAASAVDDQVFRLLGDLGIEVVHQHAQRGFLLPAFAGKGIAARRAHGLIGGRFVRGELHHGRTPCDDPNSNSGIHGIILVRNERERNDGVLRTSCLRLKCGTSHCAARGQWARVRRCPRITQASRNVSSTPWIRYANPRAQMYRTLDASETATWQSISAKEMLRRVAGLSRALGELGIKPGDRVGIFAPNCPEWRDRGFRDRRAGRGERAGLFPRVARPAHLHPERFGRARRVHFGRRASAENRRVPRAVCRGSNT